MVPAAGSGVPGAPADWEPPDGIEQHTPVLFLDLNADDLSTGNGRRTYCEKYEYLSIKLHIEQNQFLNFPKFLTILKLILISYVF